MFTCKSIKICAMFFFSIVSINYGRPRSVPAPAPAHGFILNYWDPSADCWGHTSLTLCWWPSTAIGANKAYRGLAPVAIVST